MSIKFVIPDRISNAGHPRRPPSELFAALLPLLLLPPNYQIARAMEILWLAAPEPVSLILLHNFTDAMSGTAHTITPVSIDLRIVTQIMSQSALHYQLQDCPFTDQAFRDLVEFANGHGP